MEPNSEVGEERIVGDQKQTLLSKKEVDPTKLDPRTKEVYDWLKHEEQRKGPYFTAFFLFDKKDDSFPLSQMNTPGRQEIPENKEDKYPISRILLPVSQALQDEAALRLLTEDLAKKRKMWGDDKYIYNIYFVPNLNLTPAEAFQYAMLDSAFEFNEGFEKKKGAFFMASFWKLTFEANVRRLCERQAKKLKNAILQKSERLEKSQPYEEDKETFFFLMI